ncbi:EamA family transporter [Nocardia sp. NPDC051030]|uniref:EamA family transporter n=1 Tax=Nocardia sp. NPDC051030 TaxID=3155162 RepID=UPI00342D5E72
MTREISRPRLLSLESVPPSALVLTGIVSVQAGAGIAKQLFEELPPNAVVLLRLFTSALVLGFLARKALRTVWRDHSARSLTLAVGYGLTLALMNFCIYQSFSRIPLGVAVTIEFLGPLTVAVISSRRAWDLLWVALAATGVVLLAKGGGALDAVGIGFALLAGVGWGAYILLGQAVGKDFPGMTGLAIGSLIGTLVMLPMGIASGGSALLDPRLLLLGMAVGVLSSLIPYSLELDALRRMPARVFGILMSLEPAVAALVGLIVLGELLSLRQWLAIGCVIVACVGSTRGQKDPIEAPEA